MVYRILIGAGLFFLGYYMGRELQRGEMLRQEMKGGNRPSRYATVSEDGSDADVNSAMKPEREGSDT